MRVIIVIQEKASIFYFALPQNGRFLSSKNVGQVSQLARTPHKTLPDDSQMWEESHLTTMTFATMLKSVNRVN